MTKKVENSNNADCPSLNSTARKKFKALYESQSVINKKEKKKFKSDCCNAKIIYDEEGFFCDKCGHECIKI